MLAHRVIPCLDVHNGRVVKGVQFVDLADAGDPAELALRYEAQGADEIVFLDISASAEGRRTLLEVVRRTAERLHVPLTVGGGVRTEADVRDLLLAGAEKVSVNTAAVADPSLVERLSRRYGAQCVVVAIDARRQDGTPRWEVVTHGGRRGTGMDALAWAEQVVRLGAGELLVTSMDQDGTRQGYDNELLAAITARVDVPVVASGGAGQLEHLRDAIRIGGADAVLAASIFHYGRYTVGQVKAYLQAQGIRVRPPDGGPAEVPAATPVAGSARAPERAAAQPQAAPAGWPLVRFGPDGLVVAVARDVESGEVLMVAYMNREALERTLATGRATYFSRARGRLWEKGETSGNWQEVRRVRVDCDGDALLLDVVQHGDAACHLGEWSCFHRALEPDGQVTAWPPERYGAAVLDRLREVIADRRHHPVEGSYTGALFAAGVDRILRKIGEEAGEVLLAAKNVEQARRPVPPVATAGAVPGGTTPAEAAPGGAVPAATATEPELQALAWEAADLLYHLMVALEWAGLPQQALWKELERRRGAPRRAGPAGGERV